MTLLLDKLIEDRSNAQVDKTASLNLQTIHDLDVHPIKKPDAEKTINDDLCTRHCFSAKLSKSK